MRVIYVDVLFVVNFFITFLLLLLTAKLTKRKENIVRLTIGAGLGGTYSLIILAPTMPFALIALTKLAAALIIVFASFGFYSVKKYLISVMSFLFSNFVFFGMIAGLWLILKPQSVVLKNSTVYFDISARLLVLLAFVAYVASVVFIRLHDRRKDKKEIYALTVKLKEKSVNLFAFADSGNNLIEPFSAYPVIIADEKLFPFAKEERVIPFETVGGDGILTAFKPDKVTVSANGKSVDVENVYIALSKRIRSDDYSAIINPKIIS